MRYIIWRFSGGIVGYWRIIGRFSAFFSHLFGVRLLLRTLFQPWKRDLALSKTQGFDIKEWFNRHVFNAFSRIIGLLIKLFTIFIWLVWEIAWWIISIAFFPAWILSPLVIIGLLFNVATKTNDILSLQPDGLLVMLGSLVVIVLLAVVEIIILKARRLSCLLEADPKKPNFQDPWFNSLCAHLLVDQDILRESWMNDNLKTVLMSAHLSRSEFDRITAWEIDRQLNYARRRCWWTRSNLFAKRPLTEDWAFGWTFTLNSFSQNLNLPRADSIALINAKELEILKNSLVEGDGVNAVIVGETGTGRKRLVENLARDLSKRNAPKELIGKRILELHLDNLLAASGIEEEKNYFLEKAFLEACASGNTILFIPTLHQYLESNLEEGQMGRVDISPILTKFLDNTNIQIITVSDQQELNILFQNHPNLTKYFKVVQLREPDDEDCLILLCEKAGRLENKYAKLITYSAIKKALELSSRYLQEVAMPKRALDFIEETVSYLNSKNPQNRVIKDSDVEEFASQKIGSPIGALKKEEKNRILNLEEMMKKQIVGQIEAIEAIASALRRRRLDLSSPERPAGCFLFLGPTGVGKTYTAEVLARLYYGGEDRMARLDMSEYRGEDGVTKLLGDPSSKVEGYFRKILSANSFSLILLDELEKASREVHQLLLQIMEEGIAKTGSGKKLNFRETIIIATSNAEALLIQALVKKNEQGAIIEKMVTDKIQADGIFSPELLNRFDEIVVFHPLGKKELTLVAQLELEKLKKRLLDKEIIVNYNSAFVERLVQIGFDPVFGARELRRAVEKQIEDAIAKDLLAGKIVKGKEFVLPIEYLK